MMAVFFFGLGVSVVLVGLSSSPVTLVLALGLVGIFASIYHPVGTAMLVANSPNIGRDLGVNGVWGNEGIAFAALGSAILSHYAGWRFAFFVPGAILLGVGAAFLVLVPDAPATAKTKAVRPAAALPRPVLVRAFSVLAMVTVAGAIVFNAASVSLPKLFDERLFAIKQALSGLGLIGVGVVVFAVFTTGAMSQLIVGNIIDRRPLKTAFVPLAALQAPCLLLAAVTQSWLLVAASAGVMFAAFGQVTINDAMVARYTDDHWRARAYSLRYLVSFLASAAAVPLIAVLHDQYGGFTTAFKVLAVFGAAVFAGALLFPLRREEIQPAPAPAE